MAIKLIWADDDEAQMDKCEPIFHAYGFELIKCNSIAKALREVQQGVSNNLLLDVDFPKSPKEGLIFLEQLKAGNPDLKTIVFTGFPETSDAVRAITELAASDYISKPIPITAERREWFFNRLRRTFKETPDEKDRLSRRREESGNHIRRIQLALENCDIEDFIVVLRSAFARFSYNMKTTEGYYHGFIQLILYLVGIDVVSEVETNIGRIDVVAETERYIYIMEFKLSDAQHALQQIKDRKYFESYLTSAKAVILVGISFDTTEKNIADYVYEQLRRG